MKVTINEVKPTPPPKTYTLELSQEEMDLIRDSIKYVTNTPSTSSPPPPIGVAALNRFLNLTLSCSDTTYNPDVCFKDNK